MSSRLSPAEATAAALLEHRAGGPAVMIPGAFEMRAGDARVLAVPTTPPIDVLVMPPLPEVSESDPGRLAREREGGGAPSQRAGTRKGTFMFRLWQSALRPARLSDIWRRRQTA